MKAIETVYKDYRFRSRLEARWAVFFDALKWSYEYEPEGLEYCGKRYLPDFICEVGKTTLFEIKPLMDKFDKERKQIIDWWKNFALHIVSPEVSAVLVFGQPYVDMEAFVMLWDENANSPGLYENAFITQCPCCKDSSLLVVQKSMTKKVWNAPDFNKGPYIKARQARFEHGETPI